MRRGGVGVAASLNREVGTWPGARITPMFGRWGYFVGTELFGCYPIRPKEQDLWVRLPGPDQKRALRAPGVRPHRRFAARGWIEFEVGAAEVTRALRWLRRGYEQLRGRRGPEPPGGRGVVPSTGDAANPGGGVDGSA